MRALVSLLLVVSGWLAAADSTLLEQYSFQLGTASATSQSAGAELRFTDRYFGGGTARCRIALIEESSSSNLQSRPMMLFLQVARNVAEGEIVFALLVFLVEIRGYNGGGHLVYTRDLSGFTFRDSAPGRWYERLAGLPTDLNRIEIAFYGNYE